jgi:hypothetical protein
MKQQDTVQVIWAASFVISGIILGFAIWMIPIIGPLAVSSFIVVYIGISAAFLFVFREIESLSTGNAAGMRERRKELLAIKKEIERKYYKHKIDQESFRAINSDYEKQLTEIEVKLKRLGRK